MANLDQSTKIGNGGLGGGYEASATMQLGIYNYRLNDSVRDSRYLHFKTNVLRNSGRMVRIDAVGYDYAGARPIRCSWVWYSYSVDGNLYSVGLHNAYPGMVPNSVYIGADNYVCISAAARDLYFIGVTFDAYTPSNSYGLGQTVAITASAATTSAGNYY